MNEEFPCPECNYVSWYRGGLTYHKRREHKKYGASGRCSAYLLTPDSRRWANRTGQSIRCQASAKEDSIFCGNHIKLAQHIEEIVWKEDHGV